MKDIYLRCITYKYFLTEFYVLLTVHLGTIFVNNQPDALLFFMSQPNLNTKRSSLQSDTRCRIDTINFPDNGHMAARNMQRIEINIYETEL
jgi:hypothetical protein